MVPSNIPLPPSMPGFSCLLITLGSVVTRFYTIEQYSELVLLPKKKILVSRIVLL